LDKDGVNGAVVKKMLLQSLMQYVVAFIKLKKQYPFPNYSIPLSVLIEQVETFRGKKTNSFLENTYKNTDPFDRYFLTHKGLKEYPYIDEYYKIGGVLESTIFFKLFLSTGLVVDDTCLRRVELRQEVPQITEHEESESNDSLENIKQSASGAIESIEDYSAEMLSKYAQELETLNQKINSEQIGFITDASSTYTMQVQMLATMIATDKSYQSYERLLFQKQGSKSEVKDFYLKFSQQARLLNEKLLTGEKPLTKQIKDQLMFADQKLFFKHILFLNYGHMESSTERFFSLLKNGFSTESLVLNQGSLFQNKEELTNMQSHKLMLNAMFQECLLAKILPSKVMNFSPEYEEKVIKKLWVETFNELKSTTGKDLLPQTEYERFNKAHDAFHEDFAFNYLLEIIEKQFHIKKLLSFDWFTNREDRQLLQRLSNQYTTRLKTILNDMQKLQRIFSNPQFRKDKPEVVDTMSVKQHDMIYRYVFQIMFAYASLLQFSSYPNPIIPRSELEEQLRVMRGEKESEFYQNYNSRVSIEQQGFMVFPKQYDLAEAKQFILSISVNNLDDIIGRLVEAQKVVDDSMFRNAVSKLTEST
jgi:hypothetical protein